MGCVQEAKQQPVLDSFDLKGIAERIKSGKRTSSKLVSNATICLIDTKTNKPLCRGASVPNVLHNRPSVMFAASYLCVACHNVAVARSQADALTSHMHVLSMTLHCLDVHCAGLHNCCVNANNASAYTYYRA